MIPQGKLIVTIPSTNDRLLLNRLDVEAALEKSDIDYLLVTSQPPLEAKRGGNYVYRLSTKSSKGGVKYHLETGPKGMTISRAGLLTWPVPADAADEESATVAVNDASGRVRFHTFKVSLIGERQVGAENKLPAFSPAATEKGSSEGAAPKQQAIKPPVLEGDRVVRELPAPIADVAVGGGGRYLILSLPQIGKLAVFDVNEAKVVHYIPVAEDTVRLAAGMNKLMVLLPRAGILQRWDLTTFERELAAPCPSVTMAAPSSLAQHPTAPC